MEKKVGTRIRITFGELYLGNHRVFFYVGEFLEVILQFACLKLYRKYKLKKNASALIR